MPIDLPSQYLISSSHSHCYVHGPHVIAYNPLDMLNALLIRVPQILF